MDKKIINIAKTQLKELMKNHDGFINVIVDDWRGFRFIFDCIEVRNCENNCSSCKLFKAIKNKKIGQFNTDLYPADEEDRKLFGPQKFLNCKTLKQYQKCYVNFLLKRTEKKKEIEEELALILDSEIIFTKNGKLKEKNISFKKNIFKKVIKKAGKRKNKIITNYLKQKL